MKKFARAYYYLSPWDCFKSLLRILFTDLRKSDKAVESFEEQLSHVLGLPTFCVSHARTGLYLILDFLKLPKGSIVHMSPITLKQMPHMVQIHQCEVDYISYQPHSFSLDLTSIKLHENSRAILYTPIAGVHTDMNELRAFCDDNNLLLLLDATQSFGATFQGQKLLTFADFSFGSFCDLKIIHTHRGGFISTRHPDFFEFFKRLKSTFFTKPQWKYFFSFILEDFIASLFVHPLFFNLIGHRVVDLFNWIGPRTIENLTSGKGIQIGHKTYFESFMSSGECDVLDLPHEQRYLYTDFQARLGLKRLMQYQAETQHRQNLALTFYRELQASSAFIVPSFANDPGSIFWKIPLLFTQPLQAQKQLWSQGIDCARSNLPWLPQDKSIQGRLMKEQCFYIPLYHINTLEDALFIAKVVNSLTIETT